MAFVFIDPTSATNGAGTVLDPKNTWAGMTWTPGNSYLQKERTRYAGTVSVSSGGSSDAARVTLGTYEAQTGNQLQLDPFDDDARARMAEIDAAGSQYGVFITGTESWVTVDSMHVHGARHTSSATNIYKATGAGTDVSILRCWSSDARNSPAAVGAAGIKGFCDNLLILGCLIEDMGDDAIYCEGDGIVIAHNRIRRVSQDTTGGDCIQMADTVISSDNPWVHHNLLDHSDADCKQCYIVTSGGAGATIGGGCIENNRCIGFQGATLHKPIYVGNPSMIVRANRIYGGIRGIDLDSRATGAKALANLIIHTASAANSSGIAISAANQRAVCNTLIRTSSEAVTNYGIQQTGAYSGVYIANNVLSGWKYGVRMHSGAVPTEDGNAYWASQTANKVNESLVSQSLGSSSRTDDPLLDAAYKPAGASPLRLKGIDAGYLRDLAGAQARRYIGAWAQATLST